MFHDFTLTVVSSFFTKREYCNTLGLVSKQFSKFEKYSKDELPDGIVISGNISTTFKQGRKHGIEEYFYKHGKLRSTIWYENNTKKGLYRYYRII
jgi:hypothetical protein